MADVDRCPTTGEVDCAMCSGEYCEVHFAKPCECDVVERHGFAYLHPEIAKMPPEQLPKDWMKTKPAVQQHDGPSAAGVVPRLNR